jgi:hypothetical protein
VPRYFSAPQTFQEKRESALRLKRRGRWLDLYNVREEMFKRSVRTKIYENVRIRIFGITFIVNNLPFGAGWPEKDEAKVISFPSLSRTKQRLPETIQEAFVNQ